MHGAGFKQAVDHRRSPLGASGTPPEDRPKTVAAASFYRIQEGFEQDSRTMIAVPGMDMSAEVRRGDAVVLAWDAGRIATKPINQFQPIRMRRDMMLRLVAPVKKN